MQELQKKLRSSSLPLGGKEPIKTIEYAWRKWEQWCLRKSACIYHFFLSERDILSFLVEQFHCAYTYRSLNLYHSAILYCMSKVNACMVGMTACINGDHQCNHALIIEQTMCCLYHAVYIYIYSILVLRIDE